MYWTPEQIKRMQDFVKSKKCEKLLKKINKKFAERDEQDKRDQLATIYWWIKTKDEPFTI